MRSFPHAAQIDNGDEALYPDKSGTYTKGILQTGVGLVDLAAYQTFIKALKSGKPADFEKIVLGGPRTLNGPQGGLAFDLECLDCSQFGVPPAPALASEDYAAELVELYWASLLRDVPFTQYSSDPTAVAAATELSSMASYKGPRDASNKVTPNLLFRGGFAGDTIGPYMSQFLLQDTKMGALPITQKYMTFKKAVDYMLDKNIVHAGAERDCHRIEAAAGRAAVSARWARPGRIHSFRRAVPGVLYRVPGVEHDQWRQRGAVEPGKPVQYVQDAKRVWHDGSARHRSDADRGGARGAQRGVVPEMVCASSPSSGIRRRDRLFACKLAKAT